MGNGLPHQLASWFAMTLFSIHSAPVLVHLGFQLSCHCEEAKGRRGNPFPSDAKHRVGLQADNHYNPKRSFAASKEEGL